MVWLISFLFPFFFFLVQSGVGLFILFDVSFLFISLFHIPHAFSFRSQKVWRGLCSLHVLSAFIQRGVWNGVCWFWDCIRMHVCHSVNFRTSIYEVRYDGEPRKIAFVCSQPQWSNICIELDWAHLAITTTRHDNPANTVCRYNKTRLKRPSAAQFDQLNSIPFSHYYQTSNIDTIRTQTLTERKPQ